MAKSRAGPSTIPAPAGKKMTFDSDDEFDEDLTLPETSAAPQAMNQDSDSDSDDAPEAVGLGAGAAEEEERERAAAMERLRKREEARARATKIAEAKAKSGKAPRKSDDGEDEEGRRLRRRIEAAMAAGDSEDESEEDEEGVEDEEGSDVDDTFHTARDSDDEEEDEGDGDSDESETLVDGPLSAEDIKLRARMDAMMAAMEARATEGEPSRAAPKSALKNKATKEIPKAAAAPAAEADSDWDLTPGVAPLSSAAIAAAETAIKTKAKQNIAAAAQKKSQRRKRKRRQDDEVSRTFGDKTVHLLPSVLGVGSALPPAIGARESAGSAGKGRDKFMRRAMKDSGKIPGRGVVDGRRR